MKKNLKIYYNPKIKKICKIFNRFQIHLINFHLGGNRQHSVVDSIQIHLSKEEFEAVKWLKEYMSCKKNKELANFY